MRKLRLLKEVLVRTNADKILIAYVVFVLVSALAVLIVEPNIDKYGDALWYCYAVVSTTGFGDVIVVTAFAKIVSVLVTVYSTIVIAIVTGVVVNFYTEVAERQRKETFANFMDKLERLDTLSKEELAQMSSQVKEFKKKLKK